MPRDGSGDFTLADGPLVNGNVADADEMNTILDDLADGLSDSINTGGTKAFGADQSFGGFKATNIGTPTQNGDAVTKSYLEGRIGVSIQGYDATLAAMAAGTTGADVLWYWSGSDTLSSMTLTAAARAILDDATAAAIATTLGLGAGDSPQFTAINLGDASDTTITRSAAGVIAVEGVDQVNLSASQTLTNKTLTSPTINGGSSSASLQQVTGVGGETLTTTHRNADLILDGDITLPDAVFAAGNWQTLTADGSNRTITRGSGVTMYVNGVNSATATVPARTVAGVKWETASICHLIGSAF